MSQSTIFQLCLDGSSWVEPVLSKDKCVFLKGHNAVTPLRLKQTTPRFRDKLSTTEPLRPLSVFCSVANPEGVPVFKYPSMKMK